MPSTFRMHADAKTFTQLGLVSKTGMRIHFDLEIRLGDVIAATDDARPELVDAERITGYIRSDGRMYDTPAKRTEPFDIDDAGTLGVLLLSNDPDLNLDISYLVSFELPGRPEPFTSFRIINMPDDSAAQYLANFAPIPSDGTDPGDEPSDPNLFDPPPRFTLPLTLGSDLQVSFIYKPLVVDGNGDAILDADGNKQYAAANYPGGSVVKLQIDTRPQIEATATIVGHTASVTVAQALTDPVKRGTPWRVKLDTEVLANGRCGRSD